METHAPVHLGTLEHFAPLAPLDAHLVFSSTEVAVAVVIVSVRVYLPEFRQNLHMCTNVKKALFWNR